MNMGAPAAGPMHGQGPACPSLGPPQHSSGCSAGAASTGASWSACCSGTWGTGEQPVSSSPAAAQEAGRCGSHAVDAVAMALSAIWRRAGGSGRLGCVAGWGCPPSVALAHGWEATWEVLGCRAPMTVHRERWGCLKTLNGARGFGLKDPPWGPGRPCNHHLGLSFFLWNAARVQLPKSPPLCRLCSGLGCSLA